MKKLLIGFLIALSLSLSGCHKAKPQIIYETKYVNVPVYQIPKFEIPDKPILPVDMLVEEDRQKPGTIGRAYIATKIILEGYSDSLVNILQTIKKAE